MDELLASVWLKVVNDSACDVIIEEQKSIVFDCASAGPQIELKKWGLRGVGGKVLAIRHCAIEPWIVLNDGIHAVTYSICAPHCDIQASISIDVNWMRRDLQR